MRLNGKNVRKGKRYQLQNPPRKSQSNNKRSQSISRQTYMHEV